MSLKIKLKYKIKNRKKLAKEISCIVMGLDDKEIPYMPDNRDSLWTIDQGNDWYLQFDEDDVIRIGYRYNSESNDRESALAAWLSVKLDGEIL